MIKNIFPTPIYTTFLDKEIVDKVEKIITPKLPFLQKNKEFGTDFQHSTKILSPEEIPFFWEVVDGHVIHYSNKSLIIKSNKVESWIQDYYPKGGYNKHSHGHSLISGIYYVRTNENAGNLRFYDPNPYTTITSYSVPNPKICYYDITPQKGMLILFPGWLGHEALPSKDNNVIRTCIAFNYVK